MFKVSYECHTLSYPNPNYLNKTLTIRLQKDVLVFFYKITKKKNKVKTHTL